MSKLNERMQRFHVPLSAMVLLGIGVFAAYWFGPSDYYSRILASIGLAIIVVMGLNVLSGLGGQLSLGHAGFYAIGAYGAAILSIKAGLPILAAIGIATLVAGIAGVLLAIPALKVSGPYLAMVTLAFGIIVHLIAVNFPSFTGGAAGLFPIPGIRVFGYELGLEQMNYLIAVLAAGALYTVGSLIRSRWGRALRAVSGNQVAAASSGVPVVSAKRFAFVFSALLAGLAGGVYASVNGFINPDPFHFELSILYLTMLIVGGTGLLWGPVIGVTLMILIERSLSGVAEIRLGVYAIVLVLILRFVPNGIVGFSVSMVRRVFQRVCPKTGARKKTPAPAQGVAGGASSLFASSSESGPQLAGPPDALVPILHVEGLQRRFGELLAVDDVSMSVAAGSAHALVGPNGAGKTTLFNLISGVDRPDSGHVRVGGVETTGLPAHEVAELGVARTFQNLALFDELSVAENVLIGSHLNSEQRFWDSLVRTPRTFREESELRDFATEVLAFVGLEEYENDVAGDLAQGLRRRLELARALAARPRLLLLDEPAAGLNPAEVEYLGTLIRKIRDHGTTVVLVEHHMKLVMSISDAVTVLDSGRVIAEGKPEDVQEDERVIAAYLGTAQATAGGQDA